MMVVGADFGASSEFEAQACQFGPDFSLRGQHLQLVDKPIVVRCFNIAFQITV